MAIGTTQSASSAWSQMQAWAAKRRAMMEDFAASADAINSAVASAHANRISGLGDLAAKAALKRVQAATLAQLNKTA